MTTLEREFLVALLERTQGESLSRDSLRESFRVTNDAFEDLIDRLVAEELIAEIDGSFSASSSQRLEMAVRAIREGADFERVSRALGWLEFEEMVAYAFEENGYRVDRRFRFNAEGRRWEIDVLAVRRPLVVCAECKHWSKGLGNATARKVVETHLEKVRVLSENASRLLKRLKLRGWEKAVFVPVALSLQPARNKIYRRIPVVSVFELPSFLSEFEGQMDWLASFPVDLPPPKPRFSQTVLRR
ncbi:MAG: restriction endonuclease [Candidatus Bathyarchaeota archaeon]|nr:restriction endonuclease [Candidatus Bathyarchaeota archaeon]